MWPRGKILIKRARIYVATTTDNELVDRIKFASSPHQAIENVVKKPPSYADDVSYVYNILEIEIIRMLVCVVSHE